MVREAARRGFVALMLGVAAGASVAQMDAAHVMLAPESGPGWYSVHVPATRSDVVVYRDGRLSGGVYVQTDDRYGNQRDAG